jgi:hypothetical protein
MLIELLSSSNYVNFNIKLAELLGLHTAIYISELMNINDKAIRKEKVTESKFSLDREYITKRTTISVEEQLEIDKNLIKLGIVEKSAENENFIELNINVLTTLMMEADEDLIGNVKKLIKLKEKPKTKRTKADAIRDNLKSNIVTTNVELVEAYSDWIDAVFAKEGWMSKKAVMLGQSVVDEFSHRDLDVALNLLSIAALHGHRDIQWSIKKYKEQYKFRREVAPPSITNPQKVGLSSEVF